jgi:hypothetical protein
MDRQFRLILHTAAYWLLLKVREAIPAKSPLKTAEFAGAAPQAAQNRRPDHRDRKPSARRARLSLPRR